MAGADDDLRRALIEQSDVLMYTFDFEPLSAPALPEHVSVLDVDVQMFACDATGGVYLECLGSPGSRAHWTREAKHAGSARARHVIHVDARGYAHVLAEDVLEAVALIVALPYWREVLAESQGGELAALRAAAARLEHEVCDDIAALPDAREYLRRELRLPAIDPVAQLYRLGVSEPPQLTVLGADGARLSSVWRAPKLRSA